MEDERTLLTRRPTEGDCCVETVELGGADDLPEIQKVNTRAALDADAVSLRESLGVLFI